MAVPTLLYESNYWILTKQQVSLNAGRYNLVLQQIFEIYATFVALILFKIRVS
jgi:hypothetical protein